MYLDSNEKLLSKINYRFIVAICRILRIKNKYEYNFVLVNDGSMDDSYDICKKMALADKKLNSFT